MSNKTRDSSEIPFFFFLKGPENKWSSEGKKKTLQWMFYSHIFQRKQNIHVFHEMDIRARWFRCYYTLQGVTREWLPSPKQRGLKSSLKYLPLVPRGSRETRECFSALILKVQVHEGKNSSDYGGIVFFKLLHFGKCAHHLKRMIYKDWHLPDPHKNRIFTHKTVELQLVDGS